MNIIHFLFFVNHINLCDFKMLLKITIVIILARFICLHL